MHDLHHHIAQQVYDEYATYDQVHDELVGGKKNRTKRTTLRNKADRLFSLYIRRKGVCDRCGTTQNLQCAHIFSRSYHATRWEPDNAMPLCVRCHKYFTMRPIQWEDFCRDRLGERYDDLRIQAIDPTFQADYEAIIAELQTLIEAGREDSSDMSVRSGNPGRVEER